MTIKEIFEKATSENKSLTLAEFETLAKEGKAKFTDLSEGNYVAKQKYEDDLAAKDTEITGYKDTISKRDGDLKDLQTKLTEAGGDADKIIELTNQMTALQSKYDSDTAALQTKLSDQAKTFAIRDFAGTQKFSSGAARRDFENWMVQQNPQLNGNDIIGAADLVKMYAKANADAFVKEEKPKAPEAPKPTFAEPTGTPFQSNGDNGFHFNFASMHPTANQANASANAQSNVAAGLSMPQVVDSSNFYVPPTN